MPTRAGMSRALLKLRALVQALTRALVQDVEGSKGPPLMGPVMNEVVGRDMVRVLGAQPDTGSVVQPQTCPQGPRFGCLPGTFSPSRRHRRSTRLSLTGQPAARSRAATRR